MARYQYAGPGPIEVLSGGEIIRPGDIREYDAEPGWGPWECIDPPPETDEGAGPPSPPGASPAALSAAPALTITPPPPVTREGNM